MNDNLLIYLENDDIFAFREWIRELLVSETGLEFRATFEESLYNSGLDWFDVRYAMKNCEAITDDYGRGCHVIHGPMLDGDDISVAAAIKISKDTLKLIKVWRE